MPDRVVLRVAMILVDSHEVAGHFVKDIHPERPAVHPVIQTLLNALAQRDEVEVHALYGDTSTLQPILRRDGSVIYTGIPVPRWRFPLPGGGYWQRFSSLLRYVKRLQPDIVHAQGTEREAGMVAIASGFPSVITMHGNFREIQKIFRARPLTYYWVNARLETMTLRRIQHIICISRYVQEITGPFSAAKSLIPNAVRNEFLEIDRPPAQAVPRVICMGTIDSRKATGDILSACEILWKRGVNFTFHIYGGTGFGGEYSSEFFQRLEPWKKVGKAYFEGVTATPWKEIASSDIMVSASLEESFGMNVLEAMACGTPVVATRIGGIRDIVEDGETGFLVEPRSPEQLAAAISRLLEETDLHRKFSTLGRVRASRHFAAQVVASQTIDCYRGLLASNRSRN